MISKALKSNPEYYTIWNHRRRVLLRRFTTAATNAPAEDAASHQETRIQNTIISDLRFIVPLLMQYPKCYWIWNYRQWLLEEAEKRLDKAVVLKLWEEELGLVGKMLVRDERNFHGWSYRRFVVGRIEALRSPEEGTLVEQEFEYTETKIRAKLENFSALHYRATLLPRLLQERGADGATRRKMLQSELDLMETYITEMGIPFWRGLLEAAGCGKTKALPLRQKLGGDRPTTVFAVSQLLQVATSADLANNAITILAKVPEFPT